MERVALICPTCQRESPGDASSCPRCGAHLGLDCGHCGQELPAEANFCPNCGQQMAKPVSSQRQRLPLSYTPRHLAERILTSRSALQGERKQVTVLFADVKESLQIARQVDAEEWHRILDRFFAILSEGVHRFEGTINQYTGDGIMALFGAPIAHEDHAQRACHAALRLSNALQRYSEELKRTQGLTVSVRMGLNSGEVIVGKIGDDLRMDYTAQGHTVGLAARMEQLAEPGKAYISAPTAALVSGLFDLEDLGEREVKGMSEAVRVFALSGIGRLRTRLQVSQARGLSRFVGRSKEIAVLEAALERALEGHGQVVGVVGQAGVGKSRLCLEMVQRCRLDKIAVAEAHCSAHGRAIPLLPLLDLLRSTFGITDDDDERSARRKIKRRLRRFDRSFEAELPLVYDFLGLPDPSQPAPTLDPGARRELLFRFLRHLVQSRSAIEPTVLLIDDAHWIDAQSEAFLGQLVEAVGWTRTLLLVNFRPEYDAEWMRASYYSQLSLHPLDAAASRELLDDIVGDDPSATELLDLIQARTQGNPFFAEEVVQSLIDQEILTRELPARAGSRSASKATLASEPRRNRLRLTRSVDEIRVPETVHALLSARIDSLPERDKYVLQTAAVIGKRFAYAVLYHSLATEFSEADLAASLDVLERAEMIYAETGPQEPEYSFKHPLTHEVGYQSQLLETRQRVHAAVAHAIQRVYTDRLGEQAAVLAHHWNAANNRSEARLWRRRAALKVTHIQLRREEPRRQ